MIRRSTETNPAAKTTVTKPRERIARYSARRPSPTAAPLSSIARTGGGTRFPSAARGGLRVDRLVDVRRRAAARCPAGGGPATRRRAPTAAAGEPRPRRPVRRNSWVARNLCATARCSRRRRGRRSARDCERMRLRQRLRAQVRGADGVGLVDGNRPPGLVVADREGEAEGEDQAPRSRGGRPAPRRTAPGASRRAREGGGR